MMKLFRQMMPFLVGYDILDEYGLAASNAFEKYLCNFTSRMGYVVLLTATILATGYFAFEVETFDEINEHFYEFATVLNETFYFISMNWLCKRFFELNESYEEIIRKRSFNEEKRDLYEKACKFIEISQNYIYIGYVKIVFPLTTVPYLVTSYFKYYTTDLGSDAFSLPFIMWTIFDWQTPTAYIFAFALQFLVTAYIVIVGLSLLLHALGSICLFMAFVDDIKMDMSALDDYKRNETSDDKLYEYHCDFIRFHTEIKQLLAKLGSTYSLIFLLNLLWTASTMAIVLMSLQIELTRPVINSPAILKDITLTFAITGGFIVLCSVCEELKRRFDDLDIYQRCRWYRYPIKLRRILTTIIIDSQNSDVFKIFGSLTASRDTCKKVINGGYLTIMVLRTFPK